MGRYNSPNNHLTQPKQLARLPPVLQHAAPALRGGEAVGHDEERALEDALAGAGLLQGQTQYSERNGNPETSDRAPTSSREFIW